MYSELFGDLCIVNTQAELDAAMAAHSTLDPDFVGVGSRLEFRAFWEYLWPPFKPYADKHFLDQYAEILLQEPGKCI